MQTVNKKITRCAWQSVWDPILLQSSSCCISATSLHLSSKQSANIAAFRQVTQRILKQAPCLLLTLSAMCISAPRGVRTWYAVSKYYAKEIIHKGKQLQLSVEQEWLVVGEQGRGLMSVCVYKRLEGGEMGSKEKQLYKRAFLPDNVIVSVTCNDV